MIDETTKKQPIEQGFWASMSVIILPFLAFLFVEVFSDQRTLSSGEIGIICVAYVCYASFFVLAESLRYDLFDPRKSRLFFVVQSILLLVMSFHCGEGILWVIGMPLVGMGVQYLGSSRWLIFGIATLAGALPYIRIHGLSGSLLPVSYVIPAIAFVVLLTDVSMAANKRKEEAEQLAQELEEANQQLGAYAIQAEEMATVQERNRIAREIHDNLGHYLTVVNVQLEAAKIIMATNPDKARDAVGKAQSLTQEGLQAIRQSVAALREGPVGNRPVLEAIADLISENRTAGIETNYTVNADPRTLHPNTALTLYRVVQEGLTNSRKHANASQVTVLLDYTDSDWVSVSVRDDGVGSTGADTGYGLLGIRERVTLLGGKIDIETAPQAGFKLLVTVPG